MCCCQHTNMLTRIVKKARKNAKNAKTRKVTRIWGSELFLLREGGGGSEILGTPRHGGMGSRRPADPHCPRRAFFAQVSPDDFFVSSYMFPQFSHFCNAPLKYCIFLYSFRNSIYGHARPILFTIVHCTSHMLSSLCENCIFSWFVIPLQFYHVFVAFHSISSVLLILLTPRVSH